MAMNRTNDSQKTIWILKTHKFLPTGNDDRSKVINLWSDFYDDAIKKMEITSYQECVPTKNDSIYKQIVFKRLEECRGSKDLSDDQLRDIQLFIESSTFEFDEKSMYKTVPNAVKMMILRGEESVKKSSSSSANNFLLKSKKLTAEEKLSLNVFGQHTLEVLLIHVLSVLFNSVESNSVIRLSTLIDRLDTTVRSQIKLLMKRKYRNEPEQTISTPKAGDGAPKPIKKTFHFGNELASFLQIRDLIEVSSIGNIEDEPIRKKNGSFYVSKHQYVHCKIPASDLPIRFSLPMVCKPEDWKSIREDNKKPKYLSDIRGGYLSSLTGDADERYRLLSSHNIDHFYIELNENYEDLCMIMNKLQSQPFEVNSSFLSYIRSNESLLVDQGLILPIFLSKLKIKDVYEIFKNKYYSYNFSKGVRLSTLFKELSQLIQRAGYEQYILKLAIAYEGYRFYLPAFLDFRGRIYRSGILHFHERDLARSLVVFAEDANDSDVEKDKVFKTFAEASSFHYMGFQNYSIGLQWFLDNISSLDDNNTLIERARDAKKPLQLLSCAVALNDSDKRIAAKDPNPLKDLISYPITQDASASAYQLMSYFLLDISLAKNTNIIPTDNDNIQDLYEYLLEEVKVFINENSKNDSLFLTVGENLTRKIVKNIFMPMIYGKTIMSTAAYLQESLPLDLGLRSKTVAKVFYVFFEKKYARVYCLMNLIKNIGWFSSERDLAVCYKVPLFTTIQDYRKSSETHIWVHDIKSTSRKRVTLSIPSEERDSRKTMTSTFVNFIHQKDASLAMSVVNFLLSDSTPIYTVHDNFISTVPYSSILPDLYARAYIDMGPPLLVINEFIYMNLTKPGYHNPPRLDIVIPNKELESLLNNCIPADMRNKKNTWTKKKKMIVDSYNAYINTVCGPIESNTTYESRYATHEDKWNSFKEELSAQYCLQY